MFELVPMPNFSLNWQFWFSGPNLHRKSIKTEKNENHHIWIRLGTKHHRKLTICPKILNLPKKSISGLKLKKWTPPVNSAYSS